MRSLTILALAGALAAPSWSQNHLYTFEGRAAGDQFGISVSGAGDVNGDGFDDVVVGARNSDQNGSNAGSVTVFSGRDGAVLFDWFGDSAGNEFGYSVKGAGDINGDGFDDVLVGIRFAEVGGNRTGGVRLFSGVDGSLLLPTFFGVADDDRFGHSVSGAGDFDGDGTPDIIVGAKLEDANGVDSGAAYVFSGVDGSQLAKFVGPAAGAELGHSVSQLGNFTGTGADDVVVAAISDQGGAGSVFIHEFGNVTPVASWTGSSGDGFGQAVSWVGDVDGLGLPDVLVGVRNVNGTTGRVVVLSSESRTAVLTVDGVAPAGQFGFALAGPGDVDGDGTPDVFVGAPFADPVGSNSGNATLLSGANGSILASLDGPTNGSRLAPQSGAWYGFALGAAGDVNGDGVPDLCVGAVFHSGRGVVEVLSGADLTLTTDQHELAFGQPGTVNFQLDAGPQFAGRNYWLLGSSQGLGPTPWGALQVPLTPDSYTDLMVGQRNSAVFVNTLGVLDAQGRATAQLVLPASMPPTPGFRADHAFVIFDPSPLLASNPVPITFAPFGPAPVVTGTNPVAGATGVGRNGPIQVDFDIAMDPSTITSSNLRVTIGGAEVLGQWSPTSATRATFVPFLPYHLAAEVDVEVTTGATSSLGIPLASPVSFAFEVEDGSWQADQLMSNAGASFVSTPSMAANGQGAVLAVWQESTGLGQTQVLAARYDVGAGGFGAPVTIGSSASLSISEPEVGLDDRGNAVVAWVQSSLSVDEVVGARYDATSSAWSTGSVIASYPAGSVRQAPLVDQEPGGDAVAVWNVDFGFNDGLELSFFTGSTGVWDPPTGIGLGSSPPSSSAPRIALTPGGPGRPPKAVVVRVVRFQGQMTSRTSVDVRTESKSGSSSSSSLVSGNGASFDVTGLQDGTALIVWDDAGIRSTLVNNQLGYESFETVAGSGSSPNLDASGARAAATYFDFATGQQIERLTYDSAMPWPTGWSADGVGATGSFGGGCGQVSVSLGGLEIVTDLVENAHEFWVEATSVACSGSLPDVLRTRRLIRAVGWGGTAFLQNADSIFGAVAATTGVGETAVVYLARNGSVTELRAALFR